MTQVAVGWNGHQRARDQGNAWVFFLALLAVKPFIDLTWGFELFSFGGVQVNGTRFCGLIVFFATVLTFIRRPPSDAAGVQWIVLFLIFYIASVVFGYGNGMVSSGRLLHVLLRALTAYLIYLIFSSYWLNGMRIVRLFHIIWLSTVAVNLISIFVWYNGSYTVAFSQGVERYAGLYNDPGTPAYMAVFSVVFAICFRALHRHYRIANSKIHFVLFVVTLIIAIALLSITVTKNALLMMTIFIMMWGGIYERKHIVVIPLLILGVYLVYSGNQELQARLATETRVIIEGDYSEEALRAFGAGRVNTFVNLWNHYESRPFLEQMFGNGRSYGAHNQYLAYLLRIGFVGLGLFLVTMLSFYKHLFKAFNQTRNPALFLATTLLTMFAVGGMSGNPFDYTTLYWYVLIPVSMVNAPARVLVSSTIRGRRREAPSI